MYVRAVVVIIAVFALSACSQGATSMETVPPTPRAGPQTTVSTPTSTPTPSQEELAAMAEETYRTFFDEWVRLERAGGADEPTQILLDNGAGSYLEGVMALLRDQKETGLQSGGPLPSTTVVAAPGGDYEGVDPRMTLKVCEDESQGWYIDASGQHGGGRAQGFVYLGWIEGRPKLIGAETEAVEACSI